MEFGRVDVGRKKRARGLSFLPSGTFGEKYGWRWGAVGSQRGSERGEPGGGGGETLERGAAVSDDFRVSRRGVGVADPRATEPERVWSGRFLPAHLAVY